MSRKHGQRGQVIVEFVLASSFAFLLLFGMVDFGRALFAYDAVASAARIGSRYAIVHGSACSVAGCPASASAIQTYVLSKVRGFNGMTVTPTWSTAPGCTDPNHQGPNCIVTVTAQYNFTFILALHKTITMTSTSQMVISQ